MATHSFVDKVIDLEVLEESGIARWIYGHCGGKFGSTRDLDELVDRSADLAVVCDTDNPDSAYRSGYE
jgi:hypothetical protein